MRRKLTLWPIITKTTEKLKGLEIFDENEPDIKSGNYHKLLWHDKLAELIDRHWDELFGEEKGK